MRKIFRKTKRGKPPENGSPPMAGLTAKIAWSPLEIGRLATDRFPAKLVFMAEIPAKMNEQQRNEGVRS